MKIFKNRLRMFPSDLGQVRTIMAADRTLMAWVRTSLSMLSFGFTIYKVLEALQESRKVIHPHAPQAAGMFLAIMGTLTMVMGTVEYWFTLRQLKQLEAFRTTRPCLFMALILSVAGVGLILGIGYDQI